MEFFKFFECKNFYHLNFWALILKVKLYLFLKSAFFNKVYLNRMVNLEYIN